MGVIYYLKKKAAKLTKFRKDLYLYQFALPLEECEKINRLVEDFHAGYGITEFWDSDFKSNDIYDFEFIDDISTADLIEKAKTIQPAFLAKFLAGHFTTFHRDLLGKSPTKTKKHNWQKVGF